MVKDVRLSQHGRRGDRLADAARGDGAVVLRTGGGRRAMRPRTSRSCSAGWPDRSANNAQRKNGMRPWERPSSRRRATSCWRIAPTTPPPTATSAGPTPTHFNWALDWFDAELARGDGAAPSGADDRRRRRRLAHLRRTVRTLQPRRQRAARARREARRPRAADARQRRAAVGDDAGGDEARRRGHSGDDVADAGRSRRPVRARARAPCRDRRRPTPRNSTASSRS